MDNMRVMRAFLKISSLILLLAVIGFGWRIRQEFDAVEPYSLEYEQEDLKTFPDIASRRNGTLILVMQNGSQVELKDRIDLTFRQQWLLDAIKKAYRLLAGEDYFPIGYRFDGLSSSGNFIFVSVISYGEDSRYLMFDRRNAGKWWLDDKPHFSPSENYFVIARCNEMEGFNGVQLWQAQRDGSNQFTIVEELERHTQDCYESTVEWAGDKKASIIIYRGVYDDGHFPQYKRTDTFAHDEKFQEWVFTRGEPVPVKAP
jgi:hypothetical protein